MDDDVRPMSQHDVAKGLGSLLATMRAGDQPARTEGAEPVAVPEEEPVAEASLADQAEEDAEVDEPETDDEESATEEQEFALAIKYKGQDYQITDRAEATRLAQLGRHFEERQNEIVTREKAAEQAATEADQHRARYAASLSEVAQFFEQVVGEPPKESDFKDRAAYADAVLQHDQAKRAVETYRAELQRVQAEQAQTMQRQLQAWAKAQEDETLAAIPEWHDSAVRETEVREMVEYATKLGAPVQLPPDLTGSKWFRLVLRDAMRYRKAAEVGSAEVKRKATKDAAPGSGGEVRLDGRNRQRKALEDRARGGKVDDVAPLATQLLQRHKQLIRQTTR